MHGIKIKDVFIFGICVIVAYSFFGDSPSEDSPDVTLNTNESISSPLITPSSQNTPSTSLIPTHTSSTLDLVTPTPSFKEIPRIKETSNNDTLLTTSYTWRYGMSDWTWELSINQATYDYYKNLPRAPSKNYSIYVTNPSDDEYIERGRPCGQ